MFFLFLVLLLIFVVKENTRIKLALAIPTGFLIILAKEVIHISPLVADKTISVLTNNQKEKCVY